MTPSRDDIIRMAREAGVSIDSFAVRRNEAISFTPKALERFAALVAARVLAHVLARTPPPPIMVSAADIDLALLRDMLAKAPPMQLVPEPLAPDVAAAVAAEREACALDIEAMEHGNVRTCAAAIRARGAL